MRGNGREKTRNRASARRQMPEGGRANADAQRQVPEDGRGLDRFRDLLRRIGKERGKRNGARGWRRWMRYPISIFEWEGNGVKEKAQEN